MGFQWMNDQTFQVVIPLWFFGLNSITIPWHCFRAFENNTGVLGKLRLAPNDFNPVSTILIGVSVSISKIDE